MALNLLHIAPQITAMAHEVGARQQELARRRDAALSLMRDWNGRLDELRAIVQQEQPWQVAAPLEPLCTAHPAPPMTSDTTLVGTDGSSIDLDRHGLAHCYLINVGAAAIRYGTHPAATLSAQATLYYRDEDLYRDEDGTPVPIQGALVDLKRALAEAERALQVTRTVLEDAGPPGGSVVVVMDGTLLLWQLSGRAAEEEDVAQAIAHYAALIDDFRRLGVPLCGYVSRPGGCEVSNLLRLAACPSARERSTAGPRAVARAAALPCDRCAGEECLALLLAALPDHILMTHVQPGERSARFGSRSPVLRHYGRGDGVEFVYLNAGAEIARLEFPAWVGADPALLDRVHAAIYDSCRRGWGYPPALTEAHEQATIRGGDRDAFMTLVMDAFNASHQPAVMSAKGLSKYRRAV